MDNNSVILYFIHGNLRSNELSHQLYQAFHNSWSWPALHYALYANQEETAEWILDQTSEWVLPQTIFEEAICNRATSITTLFLDKEHRILEKDYFLAVLENQLSILKQLVDKRGISDPLKEALKRSALEEGHEEILTYLFSL